MDRWGTNSKSYEYLLHEIHTNMKDTPFGLKNKSIIDNIKMGDQMLELKDLKEMHLELKTEQKHYFEIWRTEVGKCFIT